MNNTIEVRITGFDKKATDELIALLSDQGFNAFMEEKDALLGYIDESSLNTNELIETLKPYQATYTLEIIAPKNWNEEWEANFQPVVVDDFCAIRAAFHPPVEGVPFDIVITPKMSFGTGHHATTYLMIRQMSKMEFLNMSVADFGTGTGVLAILAELLGSRSVLAVDNDDWSITNAQENILGNQCKNVVIQKVNNFSPETTFDIILANVNRHIILENKESLVAGLKDGGSLLLSGLLAGDENEIVESFQNAGLKHQQTVEKNSWVSILFNRPS